VSEHVALEFEAPTGDRLNFEWDAELIDRLGSEAPAQPLWTLGGELDWDEIERVRVLSARLGDARLLVIAAILPAGAEGHGDELVAGAVGDRDAFEQLDEALVSAESGADGQPRRIGLELYAGSQALALRLSGSVRSRSATEHAGVLRTAALLDLSDDGHGVLDILSRA